MQRTQGLTSISSGTLCDFIDERSSITGITSPVSIGMMLWPCTINKMLEVKGDCAILEVTTNMNLQYNMHNIFNFWLFGSVVWAEIDTHGSKALPIIMKCIHTSCLKCISRVLC